MRLLGDGGARDLPGVGARPCPTPVRRAVVVAAAADRLHHLRRPGHDRRRPSAWRRARSAATSGSARRRARARDQPRRRRSGSDAAATRAGDDLAATSWSAWTRNRGAVASSCALRYGRRRDTIGSRSPPRLAVDAARLPAGRGRYQDRERLRSHPAHERGWHRDWMHLWRPVRTVTATGAVAGGRDRDPGCGSKAATSSSDGVSKWTRCSPISSTPCAACASSRLPPWSWLTLALGAGVTTAMFSMINGLLLHPVNIARSIGWSRSPARCRRRACATCPHRRPTTSSGARQPLIPAARGLPCRARSLAGRDSPRRVQQGEVSGEFFPLVQARPLLGRVLVPADAEPGRRRRRAALPRAVEDARSAATRDVLDATSRSTGATASWSAC